MQTANGVSDAYRVTLKSISLGSIYMNDVTAVVLSADAGDVNLLGNELPQAADERREAQWPDDHAPIGANESR